MPYDTVSYNGRCYVTYCNGGSKNYAQSQLQCNYNEYMGSMGRLATFDSYSDYLAVTASMTTCVPSGTGSNQMFIGIRFAGTAAMWDDPISIPPCAPPLFNLSQFAVGAGLSPTSFSAGVDTIGLTSWNTWASDSGSGQKYMCEIGMYNNLFIKKCVRLGPSERGGTICENLSLKVI